MPGHWRQPSFSDGKAAMEKQRWKSDLPAHDDHGASAEIGIRDGSGLCLRQGTRNSTIPEHHRNRWRGKVDGESVNGVPWAMRVL
jgi:hypothetical protein